MSFLLLYTGQEKTEGVEQREMISYPKGYPLGLWPGVKDHVIPALRAPGSDRPPGLAEPTVKSVLRLERPNRNTVTRMNGGVSR